RRLAPARTPAFPASRKPTVRGDVQCRGSLSRAAGVDEIAPMLVVLTGDSALGRQASRDSTTLLACPLRWQSAALVQFNDVAIGIAHKDCRRAGPEADRSATEPDASRLKPLFRRLDIWAQECEMRNSGMLLGHIHENV